jgi:hypothetical protein
MLRLVSGRQPGPELLPASLRRPAAVLTVVCVTVTAVLAVSVSHESRAGGLDAAVDARIKAWTAPGILEALIPGRMQSHACTAEVSR